MNTPATATKTLSQSEILTRYGIEKSFLRQLLNNQFHIPSIFHECLAHYRYCEVTATEFKSRIREGTLQQQVGLTVKEFAIIYHFCSPAQIKNAGIIRLSFRAAKAEIGLEPVVLVSING